MRDLTIAHTGEKRIEAPCSKSPMRHIRLGDGALQGMRSLLQFEKQVIRMLFLIGLMLLCSLCNVCGCDIRGSAKDEDKYRMIYITNEQQESHVTANAEPKELLSEQQAERIAQEFLKKQPFADEFDVESATAKDMGDQWRVWFNTKERGRRPDKGLVEVDKITGSPTWKPLR